MPSSERDPVAVGRVLAPPDARAGLQAPRPRMELAARALWVAFTVLAGVALVDLALLWVPVRFGNPEWEFGTLTQTVDSLPLLSMMTVGLVVLALARANLVALKFLRVWCLILVLALGVMLVLYLLSVPLIWQRAGTPDLALVIRKAIGKMIALSTLYVVLYGWLGILCWKGSRHTHAQ